MKRYYDILLGIKPFFRAGDGENIYCRSRPLYNGFKRVAAVTILLPYVYALGIRARRDNRQARSFV